MALITLLSDYGLETSTVGAIKGTLYTLAPTAVLVDLTHQIRPQDLLSARFELMTAYAGFPTGTVHLALVNPGTPFGPRAVAFRTATQFFVGPDNGLFDGVLDLEPALEAVELAAPPALNRTFRGRDLLAPAAARLASGEPLANLGAPIDPSTLARFAVDLANRTTDGIHGQVQKVDRFGNLITNIPGEWVSERSWDVRVSGHRFLFSVTRCELEGGKLQAQIASHGFVQLVFDGDNAAKRLGVGIGQLVVMQPAAS